jgi:hypothetical protein
MVSLATRVASGNDYLSEQIMEIWHHIGYSQKDNVDEELKSLHIEYKVTSLDVFGNSYLITFDISETDQYWPQVNVIA